MQSQRNWQKTATDLSDLIIENLEKPLERVLDNSLDLFTGFINKYNENIVPKNEINEAKRDSYQKDVEFIRKERKTLISNFSNQVKDYVLNWAEERTESVWELTLVSNDELEEKLVIDRMAGNFYSSSIHGFKKINEIWPVILKHRFNNISEKTLFEEISKAPLHSEGLSSWINKWIDSMELSGHSREVIAKEVEKSITEKLNKLLSSAFDLLEQHGWAQESKNKETTKTKIFNDSSNNSQTNKLTRESNDFNSNFQNHDSWTPDLVEPINQSEGLILNEGLADNFNEVGGLESVGDAGGDGGISSSLGKIGNKSYQNNNYNTGRRERRLDNNEARKLINTLSRLMSSHDFNNDFVGSSGFNGKPRNVLDIDDTDLGGVSFVDNEQNDNYNESGGETDWDPTLSDLVGLLEQRRTKKRKGGLSKVNNNSAVSNFENSNVGNVASSTHKIESKAVRGVLDYMQLNIPDSVMKAAENNEPSLSQQFKNEMLDQARKMGVERGAVFDDKDEDAIDIVGMLFEVFLSERQMVPEIKGKISKLLAPYVKVAMTDKKMFMRRDHPARKFLDVIAEAVEGNAGASFYEKNTLEKVSREIDKLVNEFNEDTAIFQTAEHEIKSFIEQQKLSIEMAEKRAAEAIKGKEKLESGRMKSEQFFIEKTKNLHWPEQSYDLLKKYWCQHYLMTLLRHEEDLSLIKRREDLLSQLIEIGLEGIEKKAQQVAFLHAEVLEMIADSGFYDEVANDLIIELWKSLDKASQWSEVKDGIIKNKDQLNNDTEVNKINPEASKSRATEEINITNDIEEEKIELIGWKNTESVKVFEKIKEESDGPNNPNLVLVSDRSFPTDQEVIDYFKTMEIGTWLDFVKPDGSLINTKLSWVSPISKRLLFVTTKGTKHAVESPESLAIMVKLDRVRLREVGLGQKGFEHSYRKAINVLEEQLKE